MMKQKCRGRDDKDGNLDSVCLHCNQLSDNEDNSLPCYCTTDNAVYIDKLESDNCRLQTENKKLQDCIYQYLNVWTCNKCGEYSKRGCVCHKCGNDPTLE